MPKGHLLRTFAFVGLFLIVLYKFYHFQVFIHSDDYGIRNSITFNAPFNVYGSERIQLQLLAVHSVWHQHELLVSSSVNENEQIVSFISDYNKKVLNTYNHMWKALLHSDITLQHLSKKCIVDTKSNDNIELYNIVSYGKLNWLGTDYPKTSIQSNKCPTLIANKTAYYFSFKDNQDYVDQKIDRDVILLGECDIGIKLKEVTLSNIYMYYDQLLSLIYHLRYAHPSALLVWSAPFIDKKTKYEIKVLHEYLSNKLLIHDNAVMIIYPYTSGRNRTLTTNDIFQNLNRQIECFSSFQKSELMSLNMLHNRNKPNKIKNLANTIAMEYYYHRRSHHNVTTSKSLHPTCSVIINSRKYDEKCLPYPKKLYPILVTSLGSSGTHALANTLRSKGVQIKHESIDNDGSISWFYGFNDVYVNSSYPHHSELSSNNHKSKYLLFSPRFKRVVHIVRCPMNQISSFTTHLPESYNFAKQSIMSTADDGIDSNIVKDIFPNSNCSRGDTCNLHFAAYSWLYYNRHIYQYADVTYPIEDLPLIIKYICNYLTISQGHIKCISTNNEYHSSYSNNNYYYIDYIHRVITVFFTNLLSPRSFAFSSIHHKKHQEYNLSHINSFDEKLAQEIVSENQKMYHYNDVNCNLITGEL